MEQHGHVSFFKIKNEINDRLREWIRQQPCLICQKAPSDPHHVKSRGSGGIDKGNLIPLCREHHSKIHNVGRLSFENIYKLKLEDYARRYQRKFDSECHVSRRG